MQSSDRPSLRQRRLCYGDGTLRVVTIADRNVGDYTPTGRPAKFMEMHNDRCKIGAFFRSTTPLHACR